MIVPLEHVVVLSLIIFSIGVLGVLFRRNAITIFMSIELMLNAVNLALVGFSRYHNSVDAVPYTHHRAHETGRNLVCRLLLEKKKRNFSG